MTQTATEYQRRWRAKKKQAEIDAGLRPRQKPKPKPPPRANAITVHGAEQRSKKQSSRKAGNAAACPVKHPKSCRSFAQ
jgi:hypothetical protein